MSIAMRRGAGAIAASGAFSAQGVAFDGSTTYLTRTSDLTGISDGNQLTFSFWYKADTVSASRYIFLIDAANRSKIHFTVTNTLQIDFVSAGAGGLSFTSSDTFSDVSGWHNLMMSFDLSDTGKRHIYHDNSSVSGTYADYTDASIDFTSNPVRVGANQSAGSLFDGDISEYWFDDSYINLSLISNREKFRSSSGKPVNLDGDGSLPTGTAPKIYLTGPTISWQDNAGTGGSFTEVGTLTDASTSPST
jgi:hypothetical protein